jgi:hypothetical protein
LVGQTVLPAAIRDDIEGIRLALAMADEVQPHKNAFPLSK